MSAAKKSRKSARAVADDQRGYWGGIERNQGVSRPELMQRSNEQAKKQTMTPKKRKTSNDFGCKPVVKLANKSTVRNEQKISKKSWNNVKEKQSTKQQSSIVCNATKRKPKRRKSAKSRGSGTDKNLQPLKSSKHE